MTGKRSRPKKGCACIPRVAGNVTGPATHVTDFATSSDFSGEGIEQFPVERLVLKLVEEFGAHTPLRGDRRSRESILRCCRSCGMPTARKTSSAALSVKATS
jgi:hypothetical protein